MPYTTWVNLGHRVKVNADVVLPEDSAYHVLKLYLVKITGKISLWTVTQTDRQTHVKQYVFNHLICRHKNNNLHSRNNVTKQTT